MTEQQAVLEARGIVKVFGQHRALDAVGGSGGNAAPGPGCWIWIVMPANASPPAS